MPVPSADAPQWVVNLGVVAAAISTAVTGFILSRREKKADRPDTAGAMSVVAGALMNERVIERLTDQLAHNERTMRDGERATIDNTHELKRVGESLADIRQGMDSRDRRTESEMARMMAAIEASRGKPSP